MPPMASNSNASSLDPLAAALSEFQNGLTVSQKSELLSLQAVPDTSTVLAFTAELDRKNMQRRSRCVASRLIGVLESIQQYSSILDTFSQAHANIAALIWGSLKLTLLFASNFALFFDKLSELFLRIRTYCPRYSDYQVLYAQFPRVQTALNAFYATVVRLCTTTVEAIQRQGFAQLIKTSLKPFERTFDDLERVLKEQNEDIRSEVHLASEQAADQERRLQLIEREEASRYRKQGQALYHKMKKSSDESRGWRVAYDERKSRARREHLLDQLSKFDYLAALKRARKKRFGSTSTWITQTKAYSEWMNDSRSSVFWLSGIIGSGKTIIAATIVDELLSERSRGPDNTAVNFFFCEADHIESLRARTVLGSLTRQCLTIDNLPNDIETSLTKLLDGADPDAEDVERLFRLAGRTFRRHFVVIDGLDACANEDQNMILSALRRVSSAKVVMVGREEIGRRIQKVFGNVRHETTGSLDARADIAAYVKGAVTQKIEAGELVVGDESLIAKIKDALVKGAQCMFLWVTLQIEEICSQVCDADIQATIKALPKDLSETYHLILSRLVQSRKADFAEKVFRWTAVARRPLSLYEIREAIAIRPCQPFLKPEILVNDIGRMPGWCGNLVTIDEEDDSVRFIHHTLRDYLIFACSGAGTERFQLKLPEIDGEAGQLCVTYLSFNDFQRQVVRHFQPSLPFTPKQLAATSISTAQSSTVAKLGSKLGLLWRSETVPDVDILRRLRLTSDVEKTRELEMQYAFLGYASEFWLSHTKYTLHDAQAWKLFRQLVATDISLATKPWTADEWANGHEKIVRYIIRNDHMGLFAAMQVDRGLTWSTECMSWFARIPAKGRRQLVAALLRLDGPPTTLLNASLHYAAQEGHCEVANMLLDAGAEINAAPASAGGQTAIQAAAERGHLELVQQFLDARADVNAVPPKKKRARTALQAAARGGFAEIVKQLLAAGADVNAKAAKVNGRTALQAAAEGDHQQVAQILLDHGANVNAEPATWLGRTALQAAAEMGRPSMVQLLLDAGADVIAPPAAKHGYIALQAATRGGFPDIVDRLLVARANVLYAPALSQSAGSLYAEAQKRNAEMVKILMDAGTDANDEGPMRDYLALVRAAKGGYLMVVDLLLNTGVGLLHNNGAGVDPISGSLKGLTPLQAAASQGHAEVVQRLLDADADVAFTDNWDHNQAFRLVMAVNNQDLAWLLKRVAGKNLLLDDEQDENESCEYDMCWFGIDDADDDGRIQTAPNHKRDRTRDVYVNRRKMRLELEIQLHRRTGKQITRSHYCEH